MTCGFAGPRPTFQPRFHTTTRRGVSCGRPWGRGAGQLSPHVPHVRAHTNNTRRCASCRRPWVRGAGQISPHVPHVRAHTNNTRRGVSCGRTWGRGAGQPSPHVPHVRAHTNNTVGASPVGAHGDAARQLTQPHFVFRQGRLDGYPLRILRRHRVGHFEPDRLRKYPCDLFKGPLTILRDGPGRLRVIHYADLVAGTVHHLPGDVGCRV